MSTISDDWYEESSPNLAATLDPNEKKDHENQNESNILDEPDVMMANCSLPTPFFRWVVVIFFFREINYLQMQIQPCMQWWDIFHETNFTKIVAENSWYL